jgi:YbbR domain-containing protein
MSARKIGPLATVLHLVTDNLGLKLTSVAAAVLLFSLVHGAGDLQRSVWVDVVTLLPPASSRKMLLSEVPDQIRVTVRGRRALVQALGREPLAPLQLDLRDAGRRYISFDAEQFDLPAGLQAVQINPPMLEFDWADREERRVPVVTSMVGAAREGLEVRGALVVEPSEVLVSGPVDLVARLTEVNTEPIDLSRYAAGRQDVRVPLEAAPGHVVFGGGAPVRVLFELVPKLETRTLRRLAVAAVGAGSHTEVRPARVDVVLRGAPALVAALETDVVIPTVTAGVEGVAGSASMRPVEIRGLPAGIEIVSVTPPEVLLSTR